MKLRIKYICVLILLVAFCLGDTSAHEVRPAYLQITEDGSKEYSVYWKVPRLTDAVLKIQPVFPEQFNLESKELPKAISGAVLYSFILKGEHSIEGIEIYIDGLDKTMVDVLVNIQYKNGESPSFMLHPNDSKGVVPGTTDTWSVIKAYTILGVEHIWFGIDHLLFVLALIIITSGFSSIIKTITAFTIAHSITLSAAVLGFVNFPSPPVEAVIALSIVFLAVEILHKAEGKITLTVRKPWLVAFTFGLLHGFGFAGALAQVGLPPTEIPMALAFFNVGVELGQLIFVIITWLLIRGLFASRTFSPLLRKIPAYAIGSVAAFWMIERILAFWN